MARIRSVAASVALCVSATHVAAQAPTHEHHAHRAGASVGRTDFPVTATPDAAREFNRGIALLHSFEYDDAAAAFRTARRDDSSLVFAQFAEALTYRHPLWGEEDLTRARATLASVGPTTESRLARVPEGIQRQFAASVEALFADGDEPVRAERFADSTRALAMRHPESPELQAFAAIGLLGAVPFHRDTSGLRMRLEAASLAEHVLAVNPDHPGAAHYIIHAYDTPALAGRGVSAANRYAAIAPASEHALHMPSHIYLQLGRWEDVERSNVAANAASRTWVRTHALGSERRDMHVLDWLMYSLVQQGRVRESRVVLDTIASLVARGHFKDDEQESIDLGDVWAMYAAWDGGVRGGALPARPVAFERYASPAQPSAVSAQFWAFVRQALVDGWHGDSVAASRNTARFHAFIDSNAMGRMRFMRVLSQQLDAVALATRGDTAKAVETLRSAAALQATLPVWSGPFWGVPAGEMLGDLLLAWHRPAEAADAFTSALALRHNASAPLLGRARARWAAGDKAGSVADYRTLRGNWRKADSALPALAEVRERARAAGGGQE